MDILQFIVVKPILEQLAHPVQIPLIVGSMLILPDMLLVAPEVIWEPKILEIKKKAHTHFLGVFPV